MIHEQTRLSKKGASGMAIRLRGNVLTVRPLIAFIMLGLAFSSFAVAQADLAPSQPELPGVCKADPMPAGYVAVGEMESPECGTSSPAHKNAWLIDKVHDKIISCTPPDYAFGYPPVISYSVCRRVWLSTCPANLDGSPNAYELTLGASCSGRNSSNLVCAKGRQEWPHDDSGGLHDQEFKFWAMDRIPNDAECMAKYKDYPDRLIYWNSISKGEQVPLCINLNWRALFIMRQHNTFPIFSMKYIAIRRFYSDSCPKIPIQGDFDVVGEANAMIVEALPEEMWQGQKLLFMCDISFYRKFISDRSEKRGDKVVVLGTIDNGTIDVFDGVRLHDDRCGIGTEFNALNVKYK